MNEKSFCLALNETGVIGYRRYRKILAAGSINDLTAFPDRVFNADLPPTIQEKVFRTLININEVQSIERNISRLGCHFYSWRDIRPYLAADYNSLPLVLSGNFDLPLLKTYERRIAVVGTSYPSERAKQIAGEIVTYLARSHVLIISGLARGIDRAAHKASLISGQNTLAFLPYGIQQLNYSLTDVPGMYYLSETPVNQEWGSKWAVLRNRLIALFSDAVIVIQSMPEGGSFYTASYGLQYGKKVYAVDFQDDRKEGNRILLTKEGVQRIGKLSDLAPLMS